MKKEDRKTAVISFTNSKGGTCKTSSLLNVSHGLANRGYKVLMIDMDASQNNLSLIATGNEEYYNKAGIQDVLLTQLNYTNQTDRIEMEEVIQSVKPNLDIITSTIDLMGVEMMIAGASIGRELILKRALQNIVDRQEYDFIFLDLAPSVSQLTINCYCASTALVIPCSLTFLSYKGIKLIEDNFYKAKENLNHKLEIYGVIETLDDNTLHSKEIKEKLNKEYNILGCIPTTVQGKDVIYSAEKNIMDFAPNSKLAKSYAKVVERFIEDYENGVI